MALSLLCCCPNAEKNHGGSASKTLSLWDRVLECTPESYGFMGKIEQSELDSLFNDDGYVSNRRDSVSDLDVLARKMTKHIKKYPKSCKKFHRARERFLSVIPASEGDGKTPLYRWQRGVVAYWEDEAGFTSKSTPKGQMILLRIAKVQHLEHDYDGCGVMIKHKLDHDFQEVIFIFATRAEAREFSYTLWEFIAKLRSLLHEP